MSAVMEEQINMTNNTQSLFVMANTPNGPRIVKIVDIDKVDMERHHWTMAQLEESYELSGNADIDGGAASNIPRYNLKNDGKV